MLNLSAIGCNAPEDIKDLFAKIVGAQQGYGQKVLCDSFARRLSHAGERQVVLSPALPRATLQAVSETLQGVGIKVCLPSVVFVGAEGEERLEQDGLIPIGKW